jgi:hypothetical protein
LLGWYRYQLCKQLYLLAGLVQISACWAGADTSLLGWYRYQLLQASTHLLTGALGEQVCT